MLQIWKYYKETLVLYNKLSNINKPNTCKMTNKAHGHSHKFLGTQVLSHCFSIGYNHVCRIFYFLCYIKDSFSQCFIIAKRQHYHGIS